MGIVTDKLSGNPMLVEIKEADLTTALQAKVNQGKVAGIITTTLPTSNIISDKVYEFAGANGGTVTGGTIKDTNGSTITTLQNGDSLWYNPTTTFWYRIPFQSLANYYTKEIAESQAIELIKLHNSSYVFSGFVNTTTAIPVHSANLAYIATATGVCIGISATKGDLIVDNGTAFYIEKLSTNKNPDYPLHKTARCNGGIDIETFKNFIVDFTILTGTLDPTKQYSLASIKRNNAGEWRFRLYRETPVENGTPSDLTVVAVFTTNTNPENGNNITIHTLVENGGSGITAKIAVKWSAVPDGLFYSNLWASGSQKYRLDEDIFNYKKSYYIKLYETLDLLDSRLDTIEYNTQYSTVVAANLFIKEFYLYGSNVNQSDTYRIGLIARNHPTNKWLIAVYNSANTIVSYLQSSATPTQPNGVVTIPQYNNSGIEARIVVNYNALTDGYYSVVTWTLNSNIYNKDLSPLISAKLLLESYENVTVNLPDTINAIVGDTLQIFYTGVIITPNPYNYDVLITCSKGSQYPRYFEYTPVLADVGTTTFKIDVKDNSNNVIATKTCNLVTKNSVKQPTSLKSVLCVGDSLTRSGVWCQEASRRLIGTGGTPTGKGYSNISFLGRVTGGGIGWEGNGGWSWISYATAGNAAYRFTVSGVVTPPAIGAVYTNNSGTFTVAEINITGGVGEIRCTSVGTPLSSGTLTKTSGIGDSTISFLASTADAANPFWDSGDGSLDFKNYVDTYMAGSCDVIYFLLSWNSISPNQTDFTSNIGYAKTLIDHIKINYPNIKIKIMGIQMPSLTGGIGANYGAIGTGYADKYGLQKTVANMNTAYQNWCNEAAYSSFIEFVNVSSQFDSENNMPQSDVAVNSRSAVTEKRGTNGVHPDTSGYYQIADVVFRNFVANFCQ